VRACTCAAHLRTADDGSRPCSALRRGACAAQVGLSGSGKSTLVAMLERLYDPNSGQVPRPAPRPVPCSSACMPALPAARDHAHQAKEAALRAGGIRQGTSALTLVNRNPSEARPPVCARAGAGGRGGPAHAGRPVAALAAGRRVAGPAPVQRERGRQHRLRPAREVAGARPLTVLQPAPEPDTLELARAMRSCSATDRIAVCMPVHPGLPESLEARVCCQSGLSCALRTCYCDQQSRSPECPSALHVRAHVCARRR